MVDNYHQLPLDPKVTATVSQEKLKDMAWIHQHGAMHGWIHQHLGYLKAVGFLVNRVPCVQCVRLSENNCAGHCTSVLF
jgi:hypothetical protein